MNQTTTVVEAIPAEHQELMDLTGRAQQGDRSALPGLREVLKDPVMVNLFGGNLAYEAQMTLIDKFSGKNLLFRETLTHKLESLRDELSGANPTALERLLVERIVTCWLHLHHMETNYVRRDNMRLELAAYFQRSLTAAQKRYLAAIKMLAVVRKLALPVLQVNIARKQVNVGQARLKASPND